MREFLCEFLEEVVAAYIQVDGSAEDSEEGDHADDAADGRPYGSCTVASIEARE